MLFFFFFSSRRRHTRSLCDWRSDVCSSDLPRSGTALRPLGAPTPTRSSCRRCGGSLDRSTSSPTPTRRVARPPVAKSKSSTRRPRCARPTTRERKRIVSEKIKDAADLFADKGEEAREILEGVKEQAQDALGLAVSEAPSKSDTLGQYRYFKEKELPLIMRLEDPGERRAVLEDMAKAHE